MVNLLQAQTHGPAILLLDSNISKLSNYYDQDFPLDLQTVFSLTIRTLGSFPRTIRWEQRKCHHLWVSNPDKKELILIALIASKTVPNAVKSPPFGVSTCTVCVVLYRNLSTYPIPILGG
jgi:hypothetical protein